MDSRDRKFQPSTGSKPAVKKAALDLIELKATIDRGDYSVPAIEIAERILSAMVFQRKKHG
jgi:hypothetical protein